MVEPHLEVEAKLVILSEGPQVVTDEIALLTSISGWTLTDRRSVATRDVYFDLPTRSLEERGVALRLRSMADDVLIAVKGPEIGVGRALQREELELAWAGDALDRISDRLLSWGIEIPECRLYSASREPHDVLATLGLVPVQDRETRRRLGDVRQTQPSGNAIAELAVDEVIYHMAGRNVRHHEVEIELSISSGGAVLEELIDWLCQRWPVLEVWPHSKYATGKAIAALQERADLEIDGSGLMSQSTYRRLAEWLSNQRGR